VNEVRERPPPGAPRVVLDTNVVVSALIFVRGRLSVFRSLWVSGAIRPQVSTATVGELLRVLAYPKFKLDPHEGADLLADYVVYADVVAVPEGTPHPACRDPADSAFLQLASAAHASALITGDADLLALAPACGIQSAEQFLSAHGW